MTENQKEMSLLNLYVMTYEQAQKLRMETMNRMRNWLRDTIPEEEWPGKDFSDKQIINNENLPLDIRELVSERLSQMEKDVQKYLKREVKKHPLWDWLKDIRGMGPVLGAR